MYACELDIGGPMAWAVHHLPFSPTAPPVGTFLSLLGQKSSLIGY
jgi:hypothetical protein